MKTTIITYQLKQSTGNKFNYLFKDVLIKLYEYFNIEIINYGNSLTNNDIYYFIQTHENFLKNSIVLNSQNYLQIKNIFEELIISKNEITLELNDQALIEIKNSLKRNTDFIYKDCL